MKAMLNEFYGVTDVTVESENQGNLFCPSSVGAYTHTVTLHGLRDEFLSAYQPFSFKFFTLESGRYEETQTTAYAMEATVVDAGVRSFGLCYAFNNKVPVFNPTLRMEVYSVGVPVVGTEDAADAKFLSTGSDVTVAFNSLSERCKPEAPISFSIDARPSVGGHFLYIANFNSLLTDFNRDSPLKLGPGAESWLVPDLKSCYKMTKLYWLSKDELSTRIEHVESSYSSSVAGPWSPAFLDADTTFSSYKGFYGLNSKGRFIKLTFHKADTESFYMVGDPIFVGQDCDYADSTDIRPEIRLECTNPAKCGGEQPIDRALSTCSRSVVLETLPLGEYKILFRVSKEDSWSEIPQYTGGVDVMKLSAVHPARLVAGEAASVTLTFPSDSKAESGDRIRFVKVPSDVVSENRAWSTATRCPRR